MCEKVSERRRDTATAAALLQLSGGTWDAPV